MLCSVFDRLDSFELPTVAHVNGIALGGGLETALSCHWRYASPRAAVGLPEVSCTVLICVSISLFFCKLFDRFI